MGRWLLSGTLVLFGRRWSRQWAGWPEGEEAAWSCRVAVPMGKEKVGIFRGSSIMQLTLSLSHEGRDRRECSHGEGGTSQSPPKSAAKGDQKQWGS